MATRHVGQVSGTIHVYKGILSFTQLAWAVATLGFRHWV